MFTKILVPLDGSALSEAVLPLIRDLAERDNAEIVLFQNIEPLFAYGYSEGLLAAIDEEVLETTRMSNARSYLEQTAKHLRDRGISVHIDLKTALHTPEAIVDAIVQHKTDLLAMATNGRGGLRRAMMGSVADRILHLSTIPMLLVRPDQSNLS